MRLDQSLLDAIEIFGIADLLLIDPDRESFLRPIAEKSLLTQVDHARLMRKLFLLRLEPGLDLFDFAASRVCGEQKDFDHHY